MGNKLRGPGEVIKKIEKLQKRDKWGGGEVIKFVSEQNGIYKRMIEVEN